MTSRPTGISQPYNRHESGSDLALIPFKYVLVVMILAILLLLMAASIFSFRQYLPSWSKGSPKQDSQNATDKDGTLKSPAASSTAAVTEETRTTEKNEPQSPETTPKASAQTGPQIAVPTLSLDSSPESDEEDNLPPPSFPAMNSAQRVSSTPSFNITPTGPNASPQLQTPARLTMPPPPRPPSKPQHYPNTTNSLRIPSNGPLPNRGPVPNRGPSQGNSLGLPVQAPPKTQNARQKVLLDPGHSPLDWANLVKSGKNLAGVPSLIRVTPSQLKYNNGRKGKPAWSVWQGKVYNITPYLPFHPGGKGELMRAAGKDGTKLFMDVHPWVNWDNMLGECVVGILVAESDATDSKSSMLDDMD